MQVKGFPRIDFRYYFYFMHRGILELFSRYRAANVVRRFFSLLLQFKVSTSANWRLIVASSSSSNEKPRLLLRDCQLFTITFTLEFSRAPNLIANKHGRSYVATQVAFVESR